jgi:ankyrin repeat protein
MANNLDEELFSAFEKKNIEKAKELIDKGANINYQKNDGRTALSMASDMGLEPQVELVDFLLKNGADVNIPDDSGYAPLHYSTRIGSWIKITELLVKNGADVNAKQFLGLTPFHFAAETGSLKLVKFLIENGADTSDKTVLRHAKGRAKVYLKELLKG